MVVLLLSALAVCGGDGGAVVTVMWWRVDLSDNNK